MAAITQPSLDVQQRSRHGCPVDGVKEKWPSTGVDSHEMESSLVPAIIILDGRNKGKRRFLILNRYLVLTFLIFKWPILYGNEWPQHKDKK